MIVVQLTTVQLTVVQSSSLTCLCWSFVGAVIFEIYLNMRNDVIWLNWGYILWKKSVYKNAAIVHFSFYFLWKLVHICSISCCPWNSLMNYGQFAQLHVVLIRIEAMRNLKWNFIKKFISLPSELVRDLKKQICTISLYLQTRKTFRTTKIRLLRKYKRRLGIKRNSTPRSIDIIP